MLLQIIISISTSFIDDFIHFLLIFFLLIIQFCSLYFYIVHFNHQPEIMFAYIYVTDYSLYGGVLLYMKSRVKKINSSLHGYISASSFFFLESCDVIFLCPSNWRVTEWIFITFRFCRLCIHHNWPYRFYTKVYIDPNLS